MPRLSVFPSSFTRVLVWALLATASRAPHAHAQRANLEKFIHQKVLANGMQLIVAENHSVPLATVEINVRNGSFTQPPGYEGLAHMYEHMFFKANAQLPQPDEFIERASALGAVFNGTTQEERVNYYMTLPKDSLEGAMRIIAAALREPKFLREELERERQVVLGEYDRNEASPFFALQEAIGKRVYPGQWSRKNIIGERTVLQTVGPEKMREIQKKYYVPNNSALLVAGDVDPQRVFQLAEAVFGDWKRGDDPFVKDPIPPIPALTANEAVIVEQPVNAVTVMMEWQGPSVRQDPTATYAADVFSDALNQAVSVMQQRLVDTGLFQSIGVNYYTLDQKGPISIVGQTTPERLKEAVVALDREIARFADPGYITQEQLVNVKAERAVSTAYGEDRASGFAHTLGFWWAVSGIDYYMGYIDGMAKQTLGDLQAYARKYIVGKPRVVGVLIDPDARKRIGLKESDLLPKVVQ
ncbi:MAG TPA: pitrilysin family protein [Gemmatimonadaceae bacterium]|nr:pitrilysin family protein [Gemmatimonadaceae bacterium]